MLLNYIGINQIINPQGFYDYVLAIHAGHDGIIYRYKQFLKKLLDDLFRIAIDLFYGSMRYLNMFHRIESIFTPSTPLEETTDFPLIFSLMWYLFCDDFGLMFSIHNNI